jgi:ATP-dependent Clp protease ATP-binding subunit ClpA
MPKINVYLPEDLAETVKNSGVPVSAICQQALEQAVRRVTAIRSLALEILDDDEVMTWLAHFTVRARTAVRLGIEQARASGGQIVGTEHLLGGLLAEQGNLAVQVLVALEIEPGHVARSLARPMAAEPPPGAANAGQQFSGHAANALALAMIEAMTLGNNYVGCEHLLLGLVAEPDGTAGQLLRGQGMEPRMARRTVAAALAGYVHLRGEAAIGRAEGVARVNGLAQMAGGDIGQEADPHLHADDLQPVLRRIERLEEHAGLTTPS